LLCQGNVQSEQIQFITDGSSNTPTFSVAVSDGKITIPAQFSSVTFNVLPVLLSNALSVQQGQTLILTSNNLSATTAGVFSGSLTFTVSSVTGGRFEFVSAPSGAITSFTQAQIQAGSVQFVQDGSATIPNFSVTVSDGNTSTLPMSSTIAFNAAPTLVKNQLSITEGESHIMTPDDLSATDDHTETADLVFTASGVSHGHFEDLSLPGTPLTVFAQQKISGGDLRFVTDGSLVAPFYNITVNDGSLSTTPTPAIVNFSPNTAAETAAESNNTVRNAIIGGTVSGGIGLGFFALRYGITHYGENSFQNHLNKRSSTATGELSKFYRNIIEPLAKQVFSEIKTTKILGYRSERDTIEFIAAIENIVIALGRKGVELAPKEEHEKLRTINELARQTKKVLVPPRSCLSTAYCKSFYRQDVTPEQMSDNAETIANATFDALGGAAAVASTPLDISDVEMQTVRSEVFDSKEGQGISERFATIEKRFEILDTLQSNVGELRKVVERLETEASKESDRRPLIASSSIKL